jgi:hypothetical protein
MRREGRNIPVVFITAQDEPSVLNAMRQTRRLFLKKPLDEDSLINAIAHATQNQGCLFAEDQFVGDLFVEEPAGDEIAHLPLACGQPCEPDLRIVFDASLLLQEDRPLVGAGDGVQHL